MDHSLLGQPRLACRHLPSERLLLPGVRLLDPARGLDLLGDLLVSEGRIAAMGADIGPGDGTVVLEQARGCHVFPGFVDIHTHLRTPGQEYKEDLASGSRAGAAGGFVTLLAMANTDPVVDDGPVAGWVLDRAAAEADVRIGQVGAVSRGLSGEEMAELRELLDCGVAAFSDDGRPLANSELLVQALRYLRGGGRKILLHLEDRSFSPDGVMNEGRWSARLGLRGVPGAAESGPLAQALEALRYTAREAEQLRQPATGVHAQHLSCRESLTLLRLAKEEGLPLTAEVTPHHLLLTDERVQSFDPNMKMNPPLRSEADRTALVRALAEGLIDCVATDHAPHAPHEKEVPFEEAPYGTVGLETAFAALHTGLVLQGRLSLERLVESLSTAPCRALGLPEPHLEQGASADLCVVDLEHRWTVTQSDLAGKSRNSAFLGERLQGRVVLTVVEGARRYERAAEGSPHV